jgi:hypothetical protein
VEFLGNQMRTRFCAFVQDILRQPGRGNELWPVGDARQRLRGLAQGNDRDALRAPWQRDPEVPAPAQQTESEREMHGGALGLPIICVVHCHSA